MAGTLIQTQRPGGPQGEQQVQFRAMNTDIDLRVWPSAQNGCGAVARALLRAQSFLRDAERRLTRFDPASELSAINRGGPVRVSQLTFKVVSAAQEAAYATSGLFDPTVLGVLMEAGYDRSFETLAEAQVDARAAGKSFGSRYAEVQLNVRQRTVEVPVGVTLDLGGIAKGWLADAVARRLWRYGAVLADLGGDIALAGIPPTAPVSEIEVADPFGGDIPLAVLRLRRGGVATSGITKRRWRTASGWQHHLIDPRTGRPSESDLAAVTVVAPTAVAAEVAAKAVLLLGATTGAAALEASPELAGLLVRRDGTVLTTAGFDRYCVAA